MLGEKNRWLTVLSSTLTRDPPTKPSAEPKPVMLRIIDSRASYELTTTLSIEEVPPHAVVIDGAGGLVVRNDREDVAKDVPVLPGDHRVVKTELEQRRDRPILRRTLWRAAGDGERYLCSVIVRHGGEYVKVPCGEPAQPARARVQLASHLVFGYVRLVLGPFVSHHVQPDALPQFSAQRGERELARADGDAAVQRVVGTRRRNERRVDLHDAARRPQPPKSPT